MNRTGMRIAGVLSCLLAAGATSPAMAGTYIGTLASPDDTELITFNLNVEADVTLQTYGFGGGTTAAGDAIAAGGTDPLLAVFSGTGDGATLLTDGFGNPYATSLALSNYGNPDFMGCPPAGTVNIAGQDTCGDITMLIPSLSAGTYTVVLSDGNYIPNALQDNGTLGEGFADFTGGQFCNLLINGVDCANNSGAYALDIGLPSDGSGGSTAPEPKAIELVGVGLAALGGIRVRRTMKGQSK